MVKNAKPKFTTISRNETRIDYKDRKFMLIEKSRGVYGLGRAIQLYLMEDFDKKHIKEIGWTSTDNHSGPGKSAFLPGIVTLEQCKSAAIKYIDSIL